jgi:hypothetical protein
MVAIVSKKNLENMYFYIYPLVVLSGLCIRLYYGSISIEHVHSAASTVYIPCVFHWLTDLDCPGCGITRSLMAMYFWSPTVSFYFHPLGPFLALLSLFYWLGLELDKVRWVLNRVIAFFNAHAVSALFVVIAWGILRNF